MIRREDWTARAYVFPDLLDHLHPTRPRTNDSNPLSACLDPALWPARRVTPCSLECF